MRRVWLPLVAAVLAVAVGVGAYVVASPYAAPKLVEPGVVEGWTVSETSDLSPLVEPSEVPEPPADAQSRPDPAENLSPASIPVVDPTTPEAMRAMLTDHIALLDALAFSDSLPLGGSAVTVTDDCATDAPPADCPPGTRATVLAIVRAPDLAISASLSRAFCTSLVNSSSEVGITVTSTRPITLTATYEVDGTDRRGVFVTETDARAAWAASGEAGAWKRVIHCVQLADLPAGWRGSVRLAAVDDDGNRAEFTQFAEADSGAVIPPFRVDPLTNSAVMISIPTVDVSNVRFSAFAVPFGARAAGCSFESTYDGWIEPEAIVMDRYTPEQLAEQNYLPMYVERHSAAFIVPEAATVTICAGWVDSHTWSQPFPDHVYGQVLHSPDLIAPQVTVDEIALRVRDGDFRLTGAVGGTDAPCGSVGLDATALGRVLCDYSLRPASAGWDGALIVTATATAFGSTGTRTYHLPVSPQACGLGCDLPEPQFFDVPLEAQSALCIGSCPESFAGTVRLRVDWIDGAESWAGEWIREGSANAAPRNPQLDTSATVALAELNVETETQSAEVVLTTDRETTAQVTVTEIDEFYSGVVVRTYSDEEFRDTRTIRIDDLPAAGRLYAIAATFTDRDGNVRAYSYSAVADLDVESWGGGLIVTDRVPLALNAELTVRAEAGGPVGMGNYNIGVGTKNWTVDGRSVTCSPDTMTVPLGDLEPVGDVAVSNVAAVDIVLFEPLYPVSEAGDCSRTEQIHQWWWPYHHPRNRVREIDLNAWVALDDLRRGVTVTFSDRGYIVELRLTPAP